MTRPTDPHAPPSADGWLPSTERIDSPNHDARPVGVAISLIVIHAISLPPGDFGGNAVTELFTNRLDPRAHPYFANIADQRVSSHFFIRRDGALIQFVSCGQRAWHAGVSCWQGRERCNDFSLGIELEGDDLTAFTALQYQVLTDLLAVLRRHFPIDSVAGHLDISAARKTDPGPFFDWSCVASYMPR